MRLPINLMVCTREVLERFGSAGGGRFHHSMNVGTTCLIWKSMSIASRRDERVFLPTSRPPLASIPLSRLATTARVSISHIRRPLRMTSQDAKIASFVARLNEPTTSSSSHTHADSSKAQEDDDDIFAELEAEIENDSSAAFREQGMDRIKRE